jgi:co-chaperonin GroES (HSP10)
MTGAFIPALGKLLIKRTPQKTASTGGVHLPGNMIEYPHDGVVVAIHREFSEYAPGDHIFYSSHTDEAIVIEDEEYYLVRVEHVQGIYVA